MIDSELARVMQMKQDVAGIFSRAAETYDRIGPRFLAHFGRRLVEHAALADLDPGLNILDVATGSGAVLLPTAEAVGSRGQVIGIDFSPAMVQRVRQEITRRAVPNAEAYQMDAEDLQFPDETFDVVLCGFALFFFPQLGQALAEFWRVLRPQGRIAVSTWGPDDERWQWLDELTQTYTAATPSAPQPAPKPASAPVFHTGEGLTALMSTAGFTSTRVIAEETDIVYANEEEWWQTQWSHGGASALRPLKDWGTWRLCSVSKRRFLKNFSR